MRTIAVGIAALLFLAVLAVALFSLIGGGKSAADVLGGPAIVDTIANAERVEVYRLANGQFYKAKLNEYEIADGPIKLTAEQASQLRSVLTARDSYLYGINKGCSPIFGVRASFIGGDKQLVDVVFCFECMILAVYQNNQRVGDANFDPANDELVALMKQLFPADEAIQSLGK